MRPWTMLAATGTVCFWVWGAPGANANEGENVLYVRPDIVVTATRTARAVETLPASVDVIDAFDVESAQAVGVDELLRFICGADVQGSGVPGAPIKLSLRGLTPGFQSKRVLVLVDGRRYNDPFQGNADFGLLPADGIERIEVLRGPGSALYGSNAMGGVINIITRRGARTPHTRLWAAGGTHNTVHVRAAHGQQAGPLDAFVSGSHMQTDGHLVNADGSARDWTAANVSGNIGYALSERSDLRLFLGAYAGQGTDENSERKVRKDFQSLRWDWEGDGPAAPAWTVQLYRTADNQEYDWTYPGEGLYRLHSLGAGVQHSVRAAGRHRLTLGSEVREDRADVRDVTATIDKSETTGGIFAQDEISLSERWQATLGVRYDDTSAYRGEWSPRAALLYRWSGDTSLFASVNRAHRAPAFSDRYVRTEYGGALFVGNPDLVPETLTAGEVGWRRRWGRGASTELAGFCNRMDDTFDFMMDPDGVFRTRNITRSVTYGIEAQMRLRIGEGLDLVARGSFTDGEYRAAADPNVEGNRPAYLAREKASVGVHYTGWRGMTHLLQVRYTGERYADAQNTDANRLGGHAVADWSARFPVTHTVALTLRIDNLTDETYREFVQFEQPGRTFLAGAEAVF